MMKKLLLALLFVGFITSAWAEKISNYEVNVTVEQSGELSITETIFYDFEGLEKHGIFRDIPFTVKVNSLIKDLGLYDFSVQLDDNPVEWQQSTMKSGHAGEIIRIKIGSALTYVSGTHTYKIHYRVKKGVLPAAQNTNNDAIRWNIIGSGWAIPIYNVIAHFSLPASLSSNNIATSSFTGRHGVKTSTAKTNWLQTNLLEVYIAQLAPHEGATVELAYPANSLDQNGQENVKASFMEWFLSIWHWGALAGFLLYFYNMLKRHTGFKDNRAVAVQYEPPKGLTVLQSGLILDKHADNDDFAAAVLELGQLGYLEIDHRNEKTDPVLRKIEKKRDSLTMNQKYLLSEILFKGKSSFTLSKGSSSTAEKLKSGFTHINDNLYTWSVADGYMVENPQRIRKSFLKKTILMLLPVLLLAGYSIFKNYGEDALFILIFPLAFGSAGLSIMLKEKSIMAKIQGLIFVGAGLMPLFMMPGEGINIKEMLTGPLSVLFVIIVVMFFVYYRLGNFTQKGAQAQKHLLGLKAFVKRVKQDEIKRRLAMDPEYLEKMLPYAVLFKETDHWLDFYDLLNVSKPTWYYGNMHNMNHFPSAVNSAATPPSSSSSGGGGFSGGGGSSGGGGGGGGGGSW